MSQEDALVNIGGVDIVESLIAGHQLSRRDVLKALGAGSLTLVGGGLLEACGSLGTTGGTASVGTIKIGYVSPLTGAAAGFGEPDPYVVSLARKAFASGLTIGGKKYSVEIITRTASRDPGPRRPPTISSTARTSTSSSPLRRPRP